MRPEEYARVTELWASESEPDLAARLRMLSLLCKATHHAHERRVIHRDLKPANILVTADGSPKILDFGVGRALGDDPHTTHKETLAGEILGTIAYMSPEQAKADPARIDFRSDIYALGVIGFELATGRLPHDLTGMSLPVAVAAVQRGLPPPPTHELVDLPRDVATILLCAIDPDPMSRYDTAAALGSDIDRFLSHAPIHARPSTLLHRLRLLTRRRKVLVVSVALTSVLAVALIALAALTGFLKDQWPTLELGREEQRRTEIEQELEQGYLALATATFDQAIRAFERALSMDPDSDEARAGLVLAQQGQTEESIQCLQSAVALAPGEATPRSNLGMAFIQAQRIEEAIVELGRAAELAPNNAQKLVDLGQLLFEAGRASQAVEPFRRAEALDPKDPSIQAWLGRVLAREGQAKEGLEKLLRAASTLGDRPDEPIQDWIADARAVLEVAATLEAVRAGRSNPESPRAQADLAVVAGAHGDPLLAARLFSEAFDSDPSLLASRNPWFRFLAARAAASVAAGMGDLPPDAAERTRWRERASIWLGQELKFLEDTFRNERIAGTQLQRLLHSFKKERSFDTLRDPILLQSMPEAESTAWKAFWAKVDALLAEAADG